MGQADGRADTRPLLSTVDAADVIGVISRDVSMRAISTRRRRRRRGQCDARDTAS